MKIDKDKIKKMHCRVIAAYMEFIIEEHEERMFNNEDGRLLLEFYIGKLIRDLNKFEYEMITEKTCIEIEPSGGWAKR